MAKNLLSSFQWLSTPNGPGQTMMIVVFFAFAKSNAIRLVSTTKYMCIKLNQVTLQVIFNSILREIVATFVPLMIPAR